MAYLFRTALAVASTSVGSAFAAEPQDGNVMPEAMVDAVLQIGEQGDARAQLLLGSLYDTGQGVPEDDAEAVRWYRLAAEQGHPKAQLNVALQHILGEGVPVDHVRAYAWLELGAAGGDPDAGNVRDNLAVAMSPEQISQAQTLAQELADRIPQR